MTQGREVIIGVAVAALIFGITSRPDMPADRGAPLPPHSIVLAANDPEVGQPEESADESAKMGKEEGTHEGETAGETPESDTAKMDGSDATPPADTQEETQD
jgi:hypothetical protein